MPEPMRLDHYLFQARLFKSRTQATEACREGRVHVNDQPMKAAGTVRAGDLLKIRDKGLYRHIHVLELPAKNLSKEKARETWRDETPEDVRLQREQIDLSQRVRGPNREGGRPTKKQRRMIDKTRNR